MKKRLRIRRLNEADLGETSGDVERIIAKLEGANITGDGGLAENINTPDEFRDLMRHIANATGVPNEDLGPWMMTVAQEFQKGQHTPGADGIQETVKVTVSGLKALIREELEREEVSAEDLVILDIPAPKDDKGNVDEEEAQKRAVEIVMGSEHDQANSFFIDKGRMYFFASADDLRSWQKMTKEDRMDKPAPAAPQKSYMQMSDEELLAKVPVGRMKNRMGGPGQDLFKGVREDDPVPTPTEDLRFVMSQWKDAKSIPGATLSIKRYPDNYKKMHRFDRGRPNMIWGDVDYPSLG